VSIAAAVSMLAVTIVVSAQGPGEWQPLFNGKDLSGWTIAAGRGGAAASATGTTPPPAWKVENGVLIGGQGVRGSLVTVGQYKDFELELDFMLAEHGTECSAELGPKEENTSKDPTCLYNSGITFRTGYQLNIGRREAGEFIGIVVHRQAPGAIRGNVLWLDKGDAKFPGLRKKQDWNTLRNRRRPTTGEQRPTRTRPRARRHRTTPRRDRPPYRRSRPARARREPAPADRSRTPGRRSGRSRGTPEDRRGGDVR
jgi:hypothetical protein